MIVRTPSGRALLLQEVNTATRVGRAIVDEISTDDLMPSLPQHTNDCATAGGTFPNRALDGFHPEQGTHGWV
jgi:hypothetical protein